MDGQAEMLEVLPYAIYPGVHNPDYTSNQTAMETARPIYQQFMPIFDALDHAGWNPITGATASDATQALERFGPNAAGEVFFVLRNPNTSASTVTVTVNSSDLGWTSSPTVTVTSLLGTAPTKSFDGSGNLVLSFGSIAAADDRVVKLVYSGVSTVPAAGFSAGVTSGSAPLAVNFTDASTQTPTSWYWDFGDGSVSLLRNPSHTYTAGGVYVVSLTAKNASGQSTKTVNACLTVGAPPVAKFDSYKVSGLLGAETTASFKDISDNAPTSWSWTFGDGGTSTVQNPSHTYAKSGIFTVALTATNAAGSNTCTKTGLVNISTFADVPTSYWAWAQVEACVKAGIVGGYDATHYQPLTVVTRDQMAVFIARALAGGDGNIPAPPAVAQFTDVPTSYWAYKHVEYLYANTIVNGYTPTTYQPTTNVTRGPDGRLHHPLYRDPAGGCGPGRLYAADHGHLPGCAHQLLGLQVHRIPAWTGHRRRVLGRLPSRGQRDP